MNVLIYGNATDKELLIQHMKSQACMAFRLINYLQTDDYDTFLKMLKSNEYEMVFVMMDNAAGMEGVIAVQNLHPDTPVIWFSNDKNFVAQSYRLGVTYFSVKPISDKILSLALGRCQRREEVIYE
ncbi:MAG: response regulator [Tyzzerella sp.]|nr:response regulator [Tyzzerella sp.]